MAQILPQPDMDYKPHDPREQDVADPYPQTPETIARAQAATRQERIDNGLDPDTGLPVDTLSALVGELSLLNVPGTVIQFVPRPEPEQADVLALQMAESIQQSRIAAVIAEVAFHGELNTLPRRDKATCLYLACHALRASQDHIKREADARAVQAGADALETLCGAATRHLLPTQRKAMAQVLWGQMRSAYVGITEGLAYLTDGEYLRVIRGDQ